MYRHHKCMILLSMSCRFTSCTSGQLFGVQVCFVVSLELLHFVVAEHICEIVSFDDDAIFGDEVCLVVSLELLRFVVAEHICGIVSFDDAMLFLFFCNAVMRQLYCLGSLLLLGSGVGAVWGGTAFTSLIWQGRRNPRWIKAEMLSPLNLFGLMYFGGSAVCVSKALVGFM
ncbi:hypothetical protein RYX36_025389 [Vicia faba]